MIEIKEYQEKAVRTNVQLDRGRDNEIHMVLGMFTEAAEIADVYKKELAYGKTLDEVNVREELGDLMWYIANLCTMKGWDLREIMQTNIDKLQARYPEKFDSEKAINRDLEKEREILEKTTKEDEDTITSVHYLNSSEIIEKWYTHLSKEEQTELKQALDGLF